jgi:hypothetical protein
MSYDPEQPKRKETKLAVVFLQEFKIQGGDTSTKNYDAVEAALDLKKAPDGLVVHTAGFDLEAGVFRILDIWESREQGERFIKERLNPIIEPMAAAAAESGDTSFAPPERETWYELHSSLAG